MPKTFENIINAFKLLSISFNHFTPGLISLVKDYIPACEITEIRGHMQHMS